MCVTDMAIGSNGTTIFIISDGMLEKSTNGGAAFTKVITPPEITLPLRYIAQAPDEPLNIAVSDSRCGGNYVWKSDNGGFTWALTYGTPQAGNATITDLAITPLVGNKRYVIATVADNKPGITSLGRVKKNSGNNWLDIATVSGTHDYMAVQVSNTYSQDYSICVVGVSPLTGFDYQVIKLNNNTVTTVNFLPAGTDIDYSSGTNNTSVLCADIVLVQDYMSSHMAFVSVARSVYSSSGGVYMIENASSHVIKSDTGIKSVAWMPEKTLLVGEYGSTRFWWTNTPNATTPIWYLGPVLPGEGKAIVRSTSSLFHVSTSGRNGSFF